MADALPPPAEDTPQRPDPTKPGQSPWLPGKSPAPSRDDKLAHGTHQEPDGWSMPSGTHDPSEHKQYDPGGGPLFNPLDGGDVVPWDQRPITISSLTPAALKALKAATEKGLTSRQIRYIIKPFTKPDQFGHPTGSLL